MLKNRFRKLISVLMIFALFMTSSVAAYAAGPDPQDGSEAEITEGTEEEDAADEEDGTTVGTEEEEAGEEAGEVTAEEVGEDAAIAAALPADGQADAGEPAEEGSDVLSDPGLETPEDEQIMQIDISDDVLQAGGLLPEEEAPSAVSTYAAGSYDALKDLLVEGFTNFASSISISSSYMVTLDELRQAMTDVFNENYQFFYIGTTYSVAYNTSTGYCTCVYPTYTMTKTKAENCLADMDLVIGQAVGQADKSWSSMEKALYINDFLARHCEYKLTGTNEFNAYGALVEQKAVCQGYAIAYRALAQELGLDCELVTSINLNHAWNVVKVGSSWYHVDTTWNDPLTDSLGRARHQYLMKSSTYFQSSAGGHTASDWVIGGNLTESDAKNTSYDSFFWDDSDAGFEYIGSTWYGLTDGKIYSYTCNGSSFTKKSTIKTISDKWYRWGSTTQYRTGNYSSLASGDGCLYYSLPGAIRRYNPSDGTDVEVYELSSSYASKGYIYGMRVSLDGDVQILLATAPYSGSIGIYTVMDLGHPGKYLADAKVTLGTTSYTYNGSARKPGVTVKYGSTTLKQGTDYTVSYSNNTNVGTAKVTVSGKGNYSGTKTASFTIKKAGQSVTAKAGASSLVVGKTTTITASGKGSISYSSGNKSIATVSSGGKVTAKAPGQVTITVKAAGNSSYNSASAKVTIKVNPKAPSISSVKNSSAKKAAVKWKKVSGVTGYQIQYSTSKSFGSAASATVKGASKVSKTLSKLKKGKTYYIRIRSYKTVSGTKYYSSWSGTKSVKIKK